MTGHCEYRSPVIEAGHVGPIFPLADCQPDSWLCGCPAGEHSVGLNCVDDSKRCNIARQYEKDYLPSYRYKRTAAKADDAQKREVAAVAEGLPDELAEIVRTKYQIKRKKAS